MGIEDRRGRFRASRNRHEAALEELLGELREECGAPPEAPGFLAGFRVRRDTWIERGARTAAWRRLALRLAPAGALATVVLAVMALGLETSGLETSSTDPAAVAEDSAVTEYQGAEYSGAEYSDAEYPDPFAAGLEEAGVAPLTPNDDEAAYELVAVLYEPPGTR